jgi:hypothetical protein
MTQAWNYVPWILLGLAILFCYGCVEHFSTLQDTSQRQRTDAVKNSSYDQRTNHSIPQTGNFGPIQGMETPFRVNMHTAYL